MSVPGAPVTYRLPRSTNQSLEYQWSPPASDGGSPITAYRLQLNGTGPYTYVSSPISYVQITGLTNGTTYETSIEAENANGWGPAAYFRPFQPGSSRPDPPSTATVSTTGVSSAMLLWTPPTVVPDAAIQWYVLTSQSSNPADSTFKVTAAPGATRSNYHFTGLNTASAYTFGIRAVNCPGWSDTRFTSSVSFASIYTSSLILWVDSRNAASYPGSGAAWSNLATRYSTAVRMSLVNSPTTSNVTYNGVTVAGMSFNGTNQYAVNNASLQTYLDANSKRETREMWLYWRGGNSVFQSELGEASVSAGWHDAQIVLSNTTLWYGFWNGGAVTACNVFSSLASNRWNHIAYMYDNTTGLLQAYVNGTRTFSNTVTGRAYNGSAYYLSLATGDTTTIGGITSYYNGLVGVNRWYNTVLTPSQIVDNYNFEKAGFGL